MKIAIIGAGITGLTTSYYLSKKEHDVWVFEQESSAGGLAVGFKNPNWKWSLEKHYHHIFTSDIEIQKLSKEVGINILFKKPKTKSLVKNKIYPLDSAIDVLLFPKITIIERLRMGLILAYLKFNPIWKPMEKISASFWLKKYMGKNPYKILWEPLLRAKFRNHKNDVSLAWFWARIKKRSNTLGYPKGGFQNLSEEIVKRTTEQGCKFYFNTKVTEIKKEGNKIKLFCSDKNFEFDKVLVTLPFSPFIKITKGLPPPYIDMLKKLQGLCALNLVLILNKSFFRDNTYWLNICDNKFPFLAVVEHTNFIDPIYYNNQHLIYIGNYLPLDHPYLKLPKEELLKIYDPYLKKINPNYHLSIISYQLFFTPFAQPIIPLNYSKIMPSFETPIKNVYIANMHQIYPWDRGTNYAVELGKKVAKLIETEL